MSLHGIRSERLAPSNASGLRVRHNYSYHLPIPCITDWFDRHTVPGGFVEFTDFDLVIRSDDGTLDGITLQSWGDTLPQAGRAIGREPCPGPKLEEWVRNAGFMNIVSEVYKLPIGPWAKDPQFKLVGAYYHVSVFQGVEAFSLRLYLNILKWGDDELQVLMAKVRKDLNTRSIHSYSTMYRVYAQKPRAAETSA